MFVKQTARTPKDQHAKKICHIRLCIVSALQMWGAGHVSPKASARVLVEACKCAVYFLVCFKTQAERSDFGMGVTKEQPKMLLAMVMQTVSVMLKFRHSSRGQQIAAVIDDIMLLCDNHVELFLNPNIFKSSTRQILGMLITTLQNADEDEEVRNAALEFILAFVERASVCVRSDHQG